MFSYIKFRFQRQRRRLRREFRLLVNGGRTYINRHILGKWRQLGLSRRLIAGWWGLMGVMVIGLVMQTQALTQPLQPIHQDMGAVFSEGGIGPIKIMNPVLPDATTSDDVNRLIFSGLTQYDTRGNLVPDLATSWQISPDGKTYTFHLRHGVTWTDGVPFTSQDVAFTLAAIQNPDSRSPLGNSWQGVTANPVDDYTITYQLPNAYPPFLASTTQGIIPAHTLETTDPSALRASNFNQAPIGTGPYKIKSYLPDENEVILEANSKYYDGKPKIAEIDYHWYNSAADERVAYAKHQILAFAGVDPADLATTEKLPNLRIYNYAQPAETLLILRNTQTILKDASVRSAIALGLNRASLIKSVLDNEATPVASAVLPGQLGYEAQYQLPKTDINKANATLTADGWVLSHGVRTRNGQVLKLNLVTRSGGLDPAVANAIKTQLGKLGIEVTVQTTDLDTLEQSYIRPRNYDMLLFGYNIGADPDVYAYWDSTQAADPGLNLAAYSDPIADKALETGRVNTNDKIRIGKYLTFQQQWQADVPSVPLYSQYFTYAASDKIVGPGGSRLIDPTDRFYNIQDWTIATGPVR